VSISKMMLPSTSRSAAGLADFGVTDTVREFSCGTAGKTCPAVANGTPACNAGFVVLFLAVRTHYPDRLLF
jgi:hypothetical protein